MGKVQFNFVSNIPLSQKQKDAAVMTSLLKEHGSKFYEYDLAARGNMREERYATLFLGKPAPQPTEADIQSVKDSIKNLAQDAQDVKDVQDASDMEVKIQGFGVNADTDSTTSTEFIGKSTDLALAPEPFVDFNDIVAAKVAEFIPAGDDDGRFAESKDIQTQEDDKGTFNLNIELNEKQLMAVDFAQAGKCFVYTGPAGAGKTTGCRGVASALLRTGKLKTHDFKIRGTSQRWWGPSIAFVAYTNRAANNMRRALHKDSSLEAALAGNILTVHSLLEYEPVFFPREDGTTGMRFEPKRTASNPLRITHLVIEESSQIGIDLWLKLFAALPSGCQVIFVGDINQLPPVFAKSILNYALVTLPVVELTEIYRQALDSPIIANAHRCLRGESLVNDKPFFNLIQKPLAKGAKMPSESVCVNLLVNSLKKWHETLDENGERMYDPEQDIVLCPYGKENKLTGSQANTTMLNNYIAQFLGAKQSAMVYEVIAGMRKLYVAVGDRVMIDKQDGYITRIAHNGSYLGKMAQPASTELTRFGIRILGQDAAEDEDFELSIDGYENLDVSKIQDEDEEPRRSASHIVDVLLDSGRTVSLSAAGDFSDSFFSLGYALTVHKAQGCEWRKVIILLHRNHATLLNRELIYTAITRASKYCVIVDLCNTMDKAIANQKIKGNTVQEKIEWFNSEVSLEEPVPVVP